MLTRRTEQVGQMIKQELGQLILREIDFSPGVLVTVTRVLVTSDMRQARVFVSVLPFNMATSALGKLKRRGFELQQQLIDRVVMKFVPKLEFLLDKTEYEAAEIESLLNEVSQADDVKPYDPV